VGAEEDVHALVDGLDYPMVVVTTEAAGERSGCLVGFVTQSSIDPPRFLVLLSKANHTYGVARHADRLAVHFLHEGNRHLAELFGEQTGDDVDKFARCAWTDGPGGLPVLTGTRGWFAGRVLGRLDAGDHVAHLVDVAAAAVDTPGPPLTFQAVRDLEPGHPA
jgi:flavin reductase (DIM6/NTAB) family NADH-FMN oxidoreductase RutF